MMKYHRMAMAVTGGAAGLFLAACSAGITTASPSSSAPAHHAASPVASPSHSPSPSASPSTAGTVRLPVGRFPVPHGASVEYNGSCPKQIAVMLGPVTPAQSIAFYTSVLPRAGYKLTGNLSSGSGQAEMMVIEFTGHGYSGEIIAFADMGKAIGSAAGSPVPSAPAGMFGGMTKNVTEVTMSPPGVSSSYNCPS